MAKKKKITVSDGFVEDDLRRANDMVRSSYGQQLNDIR